MSATIIPFDGGRQAVRTTAAGQLRPAVLPAHVRTEIALLVVKLGAIAGDDKNDPLHALGLFHAIADGMLKGREL